MPDEEDRSEIFARNPLPAAVLTHVHDDNCTMVLITFPHFMLVLTARVVPLDNLVAPFA